MKYIVILGDGMADYPIQSLGDKTPLEVARIPNINALSKNGELGLVKTIPEGLKPGSDTANLSVMGYNPLECYTGRSPLEALSMGIELSDTDISVRCNLVTLSDHNAYDDKIMLDYSSGEITTAEANELIRYLDKKLSCEQYKLHAGISYRHCMVMHNTIAKSVMTPPHDITGKVIKEHLPTGLNGELFTKLMKKSYELLNDHPINIDRKKRGLNPANSIWLWGEGTRPNMQSYSKKYGVKGAVVCAVDLIKGIGIAAKMSVIDVEGATGNLDTNFKGKAEAAICALKYGHDYVYLHIEAPDECGHRGEVDNKIKSIELIDSEVVSYVVDELNKMGEDYSIMILPDHPTPISTRTHSMDPVPYLIYRKSVKEGSGLDYNEKNAAATKQYIEKGHTLMARFINRE